MNNKMQAAVVETFGKPLAIVELDIPSPQAGRILVKTEACGVCHTDLHAAHGDWPLKPTPPFTPGHEGIGVVMEIGAGVTAVKVGDRVGVPWLFSACGHCEFCLKAQEPVCGEAEYGGYTKNGGFAIGTPASLSLDPFCPEQALINFHDAKERALGLIVSYDPLPDKAQIPIDGVAVDA